MTMASAEEVVAFWRDAGPKKWFAKDAAFDAAVTARFLMTHEAAAGGRLGDWEATPEGALALVLLLDQFPRNMFRGQARAFGTDAAARAVAARALAQGFDGLVEPWLRGFFYLPFMHSEDLADQERCVALYAAAGDADGLGWAERHRDVIARFGRFPHRNPALGRDTTEEERRFLDDGGFAG
ncbi:DUF924 family protein [Chelatococcus sp. SYSU_G07232]|uniref:DUF924 family protein n=1 Tax=Chelatococcus albus TaxID=3047466 RepID=A0ABT7AIZ6_9HYPH|nr:DUF924 family protein [Chelatococcus sp. SYSU_G07232]MDJ1158561.1 DUF924 family protein [Chelatococcus sp. SYSU_G07232]